MNIIKLTDEEVMKLAALFPFLSTEDDQFDEVESAIQDKLDAANKRVQTRLGMRK